MRSLVPVLAFLAFALPENLHAQGRAAPRCSLSVQFASYATGIDRTALDRVQALLARDSGVRAVEVQRWGREGETSLCVRTRKASDARRIFGRVKAALPQTPRAPIVVETRGGLRFETPRVR